MAEDFKIQKHVLVPKHTLLSQSEKEKLLKELNIILVQLPIILKVDPAIRELNANDGDVVKIERKSGTAGISIYYRRVV